MLDECIAKVLSGRHRVLIFNQVTKVVDLPTRLIRYRKIPFPRMNGPTSPKERKEMMAEVNVRNQM